MGDGLLIIAGKGKYPEYLLDGARAAGVKRIGVLAFRSQTSSSLIAKADFSKKFGIGEIENILAWLKSVDVKNVVLAGQITPTALFTTRFDTTGREILSALRSKCAHSIFGTISEKLISLGLNVIPASSYMDKYLDSEGVLSERAPDAREAADIERGMAAALAVGVVDIGQTVVVKDGMVLAVEAFEGTNAAIKRAGKLGGRGAVVIKAARDGHDMRFDIPVIGMGTMAKLKSARVSAIAFQAGRVIFLDREEFLKEANRRGIAVVAVKTNLPKAPLRP